MGAGVGTGVRAGVGQGVGAGGQAELQHTYIYGNIVRNSVNINRHIFILSSCNWLEASGNKSIQ